MPSKFDTNPLDPTFPERARARAAGADTERHSPPPTAPQHNRFATAEFPPDPHSVTEEETRVFGERDFQAYSAPQGAALPAAFRPAQFADASAPPSGRKSTPLPEKWLIGLPYVPFHVGLVAGLILLLVIPKQETKVRFHAAQGLAAQVGILIVTTLLGAVGNVNDIGDVASAIFWIVTTIMLIIFAAKAWQGKPVHIESVEDLTNWLEDKIGPIKS